MKFLTERLLAIALNNTARSGIVSVVKGAAMADAIIQRFKESHSARRIQLSAQREGLIKKHVKPPPRVEPDPDREQPDIT